MLLGDLRAAGGELRLNTSVRDIEKTDTGFRVTTSGGVVEAARLVIASGGLSIPKMGATDFAYDVARQFGHAIIDPRPALVPFVFEGRDKEDFASISGLACQVQARNDRAAFEEAMLFTHRGLSGPAILQISSYWTAGEPVTLDLLAGLQAGAALTAFKAQHPKKISGHRNGNPVAGPAGGPAPDARRYAGSSAYGRSVPCRDRCADGPSVALDHQAGGHRRLAHGGGHRGRR